MILVIGLVLLFSDPANAAMNCAYADSVHERPTAPSLSLSTLEFPNEGVLPTGYDITIVCISNSSKEDKGAHHKSQPHSVQFYYNENYNSFLKYCFRRNVDSNVCKYFIKNAKQSDSGKYECRSDNRLDCTRDKLILEFNEPSPPSFSDDHPRQFNISVGSKLNLRCNASGVPRPVITWFKDGHLVPSSPVRGVKGYSILTLESVRLSDQGEYWCQANSILGWNKSFSMNVTVLWKPVFSIHPKSISAYLDENVAKITLSCEARGSPRPVIGWLRNNSTVMTGTVFENGSISTLELRFTKITEEPYKYRCVASNLVGKTLSKEATLQISKRIINLPAMIEPAFYLHPKSVLASRDETVEFKCAARGFPSPNITWIKDGMEFTDKNTQLSQRILNESVELVIKILSVSDRHVGYYSCLATALNVRVSSRDAVLTLSGRETNTVWLTVGIGMALLAVIMIIVLIVYKRQRIWQRTNYQINKEMIKSQEEFAQVKMTNSRDAISQLRDHGQIDVDYNSEDGAPSMTDRGAIIDDEEYLKSLTDDRNWQVSRDRLTITEQMLGGGEFGVVKKGIYLRTDGNELPVAVKMLKENADQQQRLALISELETLIQVGRHPNIVSLVGACTFEEPLCIIIELVCGGSLDKLLRSSRVHTEVYDPVYANIWSRLTERELLKIASDIASGMRHLESKQCIHRDLACRNILVGNGLVAKVADFGMARDISSDGQYVKTTEGRIPWLWMSMEALRGTNTTKGDVWSFGVVLWEIVTLGELPYKGVKSVVELHDLLQDGVRLKKPTHCSDELYNIMLLCWKRSPDDRPSFNELHLALREILQEKERTYINVTVFEEQEMDGQEDTIL